MLILQLAPIKQSALSTTTEGNEQTMMQDERNETNRVTYPVGSSRISYTCRASQAQRRIFEENGVFIGQKVAFSPGLLTLRTLYKLRCMMHGKRPRFRAVSFFKSSLPTASKICVVLCQNTTSLEVMSLERVRSERVGCVPKVHVALRYESNDSKPNGAWRQIITL
jgi:hypothetical protein